MSVNIRPIAANKKQLKEYLSFANDLYRDNPYYVPGLEFDDLNTLLPSKNPALEFCDSQSFMAYRDGRPVGRITGIINHANNEKSGRAQARFGFVDYIDDPEVTDALFGAVENWARKHGCTEIIGPMGFTDMDHEGMLIEGFQEMGTMATIYNHPYYPAHVERLGYTKDTDWIEFRIKVPSQIPDKMSRIAQLVLKKYNLRILKFTSTKKIKDQYGRALFDLINQTYDHLYGYTTLTERQIDYYIDMYLSLIRLDYVSVIVDADDRLVGVGVSIPSLSKALQKSRGKLFPFGWYHLLKAMKGKNPVVDLLLIAVAPEYQNKGINALFFYDLIPVYVKNGVQEAETNIELEENLNVQSQWEYFERRQHRRRRAYRKQL